MPARTVANVIRIDVSQAIREANQLFLKLRGPGRSRSRAPLWRAVARAINHTAAKVNTQAKREIRDAYKIKTTDVAKAFTLAKGNSIRLSAVITARGKPIPLLPFGARQTKKGVTVNIAGTRQLVKHAFIVTLKSGHKAVMARGKYTGNHWLGRRERDTNDGNDLAINELMSKSVPTALMNINVLASLEEKLETDFPNRLEHEIKNIFRSSGGDVGGLF